MKIILTKDIKGLGQEGEIHEVRDGYARNYLLPKGLAIEASGKNIKKIEQIKKSADLKREKLLRETEELQKKLDKISITIEANAGEEEKLFGSITAEDIVNALKSQHDIQIDKHQVNIEEPIKKLGIYKVNIHLIGEIRAELKVWIVQKQNPA
ncbi:MAG TPA: 50S ribosomal protein L9 [bacterium]|uniref:Large ribosomal subunit protein bL9 n=1 Tax=candidate division TA06 bacterium ADurb.Bin131 TaxID=1852827 RepID=A0A1V6CA34_UNCT6|nr:MAG: 50S ribosomal protein L9 [candidate division TA06 bacterium ADurb.Bin131]HOQ81511.1 50S ribosomal protein L9 [bacterium]